MSKCNRSIIDVFYPTESFIQGSKENWGLGPGGKAVPFEHINLSFVLCGSGDKREARFAEIESALLHLHLANSGLLRSLFLVSAQRQGTKSCLSKSMLTRLVQSLVLSPERKLLYNNTQILSLRRIREKGVISDLHNKKVFCSLGWDLNHWLNPNSSIWQLDSRAMFLY